MDVLFIFFFFKEEAANQVLIRSVGSEKVLKGNLMMRTALPLTLATLSNDSDK